MPPATQPIPLLILQDLETTLLLPDGGDDFFHDVLQVVVADTDIGASVVSEVPGIVLEMVGTDEDRERLLAHESTDVDFRAYGVLEDGVELQTGLTRLMHDIHRAIMMDIKRGSHPTTSQDLAIDTEWLGWNLELPIPGENPRGWVETRFRVHYRTSVTDMTLGS